MTPPYRLVTGSAIEFLRGMEPRLFHAGCTSIPYWKQREYPVKGAYGQEPTREEWADNQVAVFSEARRVLRDDGTFFVVVGEASTDRKTEDGDLKSGEVSLQAPYLAERFRQDGWWIKALVVLEFSNRTPTSCYNRPVQSHEYGILLAKTENGYFWDYISSREAGVAHERLARTVWTGKTEKAYRDPRNDFKHTSTYPRWIPDRYLSAAVSEDGVCAACGAPRRPTIKKASGGSTGKSWHDHDNDSVRGNAKRTSSKDYVPAIITGWHRGCRCRPSGNAPPMVLDPYAGTSTTGVVAMTRGCAFVGVDIDERCIQVSRIRLAEHAKSLETPLFDSRKASRRQTSFLSAEE